WQDTDAGLKADDRDDRLFTAALLLASYRFPTGGTSAVAGYRSEPIDAELSKRILGVLAEADWFPKPGADAVNPNQILRWLELKRADGWTLVPTGGADFARKLGEAGKSWVTTNKETYRIKRLIPPDAEKGPGK